MAAELTWYVIRSTGIVAWALLSVAVLGGLAAHTRALGRRVRPAWLLDHHRYVAGLAVVATAVHVLGVAIDPWIDLTPLEVLVPFVSRWEPLAVAPGIVALYLLVAIQLTSLLQRRVGLRLWRAVHRLAGPAWVLATWHLVVAGTDAVNLALALGVVATTGLMAFAWTVRAALPWRRRRSPRPSARSTGPTPGPGVGPPSRVAS